MKKLKRLFSAGLVVIFITAFLFVSVFAQSSKSSQMSVLETNFKDELSKILNPDTPLSCDIIVTSTGQKSVGYGFNLIINETSSYKVAADRKNKKFFVQIKKNNKNQAFYLNNSNFYMQDPKDNKYSFSSVPAAVLMTINMLDSSLSQPMNKFSQKILSYISSQSSSILKSAAKTTTTVGSKKISCWQLSTTLPNKMLEPAFKEFLSETSKAVLSQFNIMLDVYLKSLTDEEKKALNSLNIDVNKLSSAEVSKQIGNELSKLISSIKTDDYKISFYVDEKTGKIVKIIIKNMPTANGGISSRVEITNIVTGSNVKFPQIPQNMIKQQQPQPDVLGLLKLIEGFITKMQQMK